MKKIVHVLFFVSNLLLCPVIHPQIFEGNLTLTNPAQIDTFSYTSVTGNLRIDDAGGIDDPNGVISNLNGLSELTSVGGDLWIESNPGLMSIEGLSALDSVGGRLFIITSGQLRNLNGLANLRFVGT